MKLLFIFLLFFCLFIQNSKEILSEKERSVKLEKFKDKTLISESNYNQGLLERHSSKASTLNKSNKPLKFKSAKEKSKYQRKYHRTNNNNG